MPTETAKVPTAATTPDAATSVETAPASDGAGSSPSADAGAASTPEAPAKEEAEKGTPSDNAYRRELKARDARITRREIENGKRHETLTAKERQAEARLKAIEEREKLLDEDPLAYATKHKGWREEDLARRFLNGAKPSKQEIDYREQQARAAELEKRDKEIAELRKMLEDNVVAPRKAEAQRAQVDQLKRDYTRFATVDNATKYPALARAILNDAEGAFDIIDATALQLRQAGEQRNGPPFWHAIAERIDARLAKILGAHAGAPAADAATKGSEKTGQKGQEADPKTAPTLSGKGAAERATIVQGEDLLAEELEDPIAFRKKLIAAAKKARTAA